MSFLIAHTYFAFHWWMLPLFIAFAAILATCIVKLRKQRQIRDDLRDRLEEYENVDIQVE